MLKLDSYAQNSCGLALTILTHVSNGKRTVSDVKQREKMFAVCACTQMAVT